ncbi:hypothetical protein [Corynebacterium cystitidis]|uniref:hypothetical protein n=1 Tax=Corynebacterium cystitidis TaxID=35757 RepID=UPI00211EF107|nr:hypothetical protein [Corynebacterium cystitidis]
MTDIANVQAAVELLGMWLFAVSILALVAIAGLMRAVHLWGELMQRQFEVERRVRMLERAGGHKPLDVVPAGDEA